jgi:hypothetical protein
MSRAGAFVIAVLLFAASCWLLSGCSFRFEYGDEKYGTVGVTYELPSVKGLAK